MKKAVKPKTPTEPTKDSYFLHLGGSEKTMKANLDGFVFLHEDERRIVVLAKSVLDGKEDLPSHRRDALKALLKGYTGDFVITKTLLAMRGTGF